MFTSLFYLLLLLLLASISWGLHRAGFKWITPWIGMGLWLCYVSTLAHFGIFRSFTPPPRIPLLIILPAFGWMYWFFKTGRHHSLLLSVPRWQPIAFQVFRIGVEGLIWGTFLRGLLSKEASFEGYNYDIISGITAPIVVLLVYRWKWLSEKWVFWWNLMGLGWLVKVVFIFITLGVAPWIWGYSTTPINPDFGEMPYLLIASVYMPVAVFMHVFSLLQLRAARS